MDWVTTYGIPQPQGGWFVTEQHVYSAANYDKAISISYRECKRGERVIEVQAIHPDRDLLDYDSIDVI
jgi:hypothetical protein